jgi:hypothetical protein
MLLTFLGQQKLAPSILRHAFIILRDTYGIPGLATAVQGMLIASSIIPVAPPGMFLVSARMLLIVPAVGICGIKAVIHLNIS